MLNVKVRLLCCIGLKKILIIQPILSFMHTIILHYIHKQCDNTQYIPSSIIGFSLKLPFLLKIPPNVCFFSPQSFFYYKALLVCQNALEYKFLKIVKVNLQMLLTFNSKCNVNASTPLDYVAVGKVTNVFHVYIGQREVHALPRCHCRGAHRQ